MVGSVAVKNLSNTLFGGLFGGLFCELSGRLFYELSEALVGALAVMPGTLKEPAYAKRRWQAATAVVESLGVLEAGEIR